MPRRPDPVAPSPPPFKRPTLRHHKASGQGYVRVKGKFIYLGPYDDPAIDQRYAALCAELRANAGRVPIPAEDIVVHELCLDYLRFCENRYRDKRTGKPSARVAAIKGALRVLCKLYADRPAVSIRPRDLFCVQNEMRYQQLNRRTINERVQVIRRMYSWAEARGMIEEQVAARLAVVKGLTQDDQDVLQPRKVPPVAQERVDALECFVSPVIWAMIQVQLITGMRPVEVCDLRPCDIDRSDEVWVYTPEHHKTQHRGKDALICFGPRAQQILTPYILKAEETGYLFTPAESEAWHREQRHRARKTKSGYGNNPGDNLKRDPQWKPGQRWNTTAYRKSIHRGCDIAWPLPRKGMNEDEINVWRKKHRWNPNQLRHLAGTIIRKQHGLEAAALALGHSSEVLTDMIYAERDKARLKAIMAVAG